MLKGEHQHADSERVAAADARQLAHKIDIARQGVEGIAYMREDVAYRL